MNKQRMLEDFRREFKSIKKKSKFFKFFKKIQEKGFEIFNPFIRLTVDSFFDVEGDDSLVCWIYKNDSTYRDVEFPVNMLWHLLDLREAINY